MKPVTLHLFVILFLAFSAIGCSNYERLHYEPGIVFGGSIDKEEANQVFEWIGVDDITTTCPLTMNLRGKSFRLSQISIEDLRQLGAEIITYEGSGSIASLSLPCEGNGEKTRVLSLLFRFQKGDQVLEMFTASANRNRQTIFRLTYEGRGTISFPTTKAELLSQFGQPQSSERVLME